MRLRDILNLGRFIQEHTGPNRRKRKRVEAEHKAELPKRGLARTRPRNWRYKIRKDQKARRKQSWRGKAP